MAVTKIFVENLPKIMDIKFTAHMEEDLDKIAHGELDRDKLLKNFINFKKDLEKIQVKTAKRRAGNQLKLPVLNVKNKTGYSIW